MSEKIYIIRYKLLNWDRWCHSVRISSHNTYSIGKRSDESVIKMTLVEAEENVIEIKRIRKQRKGEVTQIQIINTETGEIVNGGQEEISRFELMEL